MKSGDLPANPAGTAGTLTKFEEGLGGRLAERWVAILVTPSFAFWIGGLLAWAWQYGWSPVLGDTTDSGWLKRLADQPQAVQIAVLVGVLVLVSASSTLVARLDQSVLRFLEGHWPPWLTFLRTAMISRQARRWLRKTQRWEELVANWREVSNHTSSAQDELALLDWALRKQFPGFDRLMPTDLGNVVRVTERYPAIRYGLDTATTWPRLWLLLPTETKKDLIDARSAITAAVQAWIWGILFLLWSIWAPWALAVGVAVAVIANGSAIAAASVYGDLLNAAYDVHRGELYKALKLPLPTSPADEPASGQQLSEYLYRGFAPELKAFQ